MENKELCNLDEFDIEISQDDTEKSLELLPVITYLAGYCCFVVTKKLKCNFCKDLLTCNENLEDLPDNNNYIQGISRGSLLYPDEAVVNIILYNYITIN